MSGLSDELYKECVNVLLECEIFSNFQYLRSFCEGISILNTLVLNQLQEANTKQLLVMLNLPILIKTIHQERGCVFVIFLTNLRDIFYSQEQDMWYKVDRLCSQVRQQLENKTETSNSSISFFKTEVFESIIEIDFKAQVDTVRDAIEWQRTRKRTAAFLIHGYDERFGQKVLLTRLFRKFPELINGRRIPRDLTGMSDVNELWEQIAPDFLDSRGTSEQIITAMLESLKSQNLIFIFSGVHLTITGFLPDLIEKFWVRILSKVNHRETYLVMFLVDNQGRVCKSGVSLAWHFQNPAYPSYPLHLPPATQFSYDQLNDWVNNAVAKNIVPRSLLVDTLLQESHGGIPELVYKRISYYCDSSWEGGLAKWLIQ